MQFLDRMSRDRKLDRLIEQWIEYRDMVSRLGGQHSSSPEQERRFLELKASISSSLPMLADAGQPGAINTEVQANIRGMTDLMNAQLNLADHPPGDDFLNRWHAHYLYLNKYKGMGHQPRVGRPLTAGSAPASIPGEAFYKGGFVHRYIRPIFDNWFTRFVVRVAVLAGILILVAKVLNVDLRQAPDWARRTANDWWGSGSTNTASNARSPRGPLAIPGESRDMVNHSTRTHQDAIDSAVNGGRGGSGPTAAVRPGQAHGTTGVSRDRTISINGPGRKGNYSPDGTDVFVPPDTPGIVHDASMTANRIIPRPVKQFFEPVIQRYGVEVTVAMVGIGLLLVAYMIFGRAR